MLHVPASRQLAAGVSEQVEKRHKVSVMLISATRRVTTTHSDYLTSLEPPTRTYHQQTDRMLLNIDWYMNSTNLLSQSFTVSQLENTRFRFTLPQLRSRFGERSFSHTGPSAWNALPSDIRAVEDRKAFRQAVKTHYFSLLFSVLMVLSASYLRDYWNTPMSNL